MTNRLVSGCEETVVYTDREQLRIPLTELVPVTHAFPTVHTASFEDEGGPYEPGHRGSKAVHVLNLPH